MRSRIIASSYWSSNIYQVLDGRVLDRNWARIVVLGRVRVRVRVEVRSGLESRVRV